MFDDGIDIIVINCNNDGYIQDCLQSITQNTQGRFNLIVVDQNSTDGSKEWVLNSGLASHIILNKKNVGVGEARNQAVRVSRNPWIAFIDSDIIINDRNWLDKMWNYTSNNRIGFIETRVFLEKWDSGKQMFAGPAFCLLRRQCFNEVGFFDKKQFMYEDLDWYVRLEHSWWQVAYCPDTDVLHINHVTMKNTFEDKKWKELVAQGDVLLKHKYKEEFLVETLYTNTKRRWEQMEKVLKVNKEGVKL